jgi:hypothetical protein
MSHVEPHQPRPRGVVESDLCVTLSNYGPLSLRSLCVNSPGKHRPEGEVLDAIERLRGIGLVEELPGGLFKLNAAAIQEVVRKAVGEERRGYAVPVDRPVFR